MSSEQVWYRFEGKKKDGTVLKLRIQDLPPSKLNDALDLLVNIFARDETVHRAVGMVNNPIALEARKKFYIESLLNPTFHTVICCADDSDVVMDIVGLSIMSLSTDITSRIDQINSTNGTARMTKEEKKHFEIHSEYLMKYNPVKEFNLDKYYDDKGLVVAPPYRGLGIAQQFFKVRRMMCEAHGVPMTGSWMTGVGTQIAAARDGWETVCEVEYDYLAEKYGVTFTDAPPTFKFMLAKVNIST